MHKSIITEGDLARLVSLRDPHTKLESGAVGLVSRVTAEVIDVDWASGSSLSILAGEGDQIVPVSPSQVPTDELYELAVRVQTPRNHALVDELGERGLLGPPAFRVLTTPRLGGPMSVQRHWSMAGAEAQVADVLGNPIGHPSGWAEVVSEGDIVCTRPEAQP